ncbi:MAG TPA: alpha/beta fold hydrolase [Tepidisphaeraceae bacterium]
MKTSAKAINVMWGLALGVWLAATSARADTRADFLKLIDRPRVPAAPQVAPTASTHPLAGLAEFHFTFASEANQRVPGLIVKPADPTPPPRRPTVIVLHGTGGSKESELPLLRDLAAKGFIAIAIDGPWHGERSKEGKGSADYQDAILRAWRDPGHSHPFYFDTVWDVMRLIDYLDHRDDVDTDRIGLIGFSKGGIETYLTAAVEPRIAVAVPCIGVQSFHWALDNDKWQSRVGTIKTAFDSAAREAGASTPDERFVWNFYERVSPGLDGEFDGPQMLPLMAPRPLMVINGDSDDRTPLPGLKLCTDAAEAAYRAAHAEDRFVVRIQPHTGHKVTDESMKAAVAFLVEWLQPVSPTDPTTKPASTRPQRMRPSFQIAKTPINPNLPTLWLIGDSTVRNGRDTGDNGQWGWGNPIAYYFDQTKINVQNRAVGGTSSRTFMREQWPWILEEIKPGDYMIMQFGHNDGGAVNDGSRARASLKGNGEETQEIDNLLTHEHEVVHTYGWYLRKYISDAKEKGVVYSIVCSPIPRNRWADGKVGRNTTFNEWAEQAAKETGVAFINLNELIASKYDPIGQQKVTDLFFPVNEVVHPDWAGAILNAECVIEGMKRLDNCPIVPYLLPDPPKDLKNPSGKPR